MLRRFTHLRELSSQTGVLCGELAGELLEALRFHAPSVEHLRCYTARAMNDTRSLLGIALGGVLFVALLLAGRTALAYTAFLAAFLLFCLTTRLSLNWQILLGGTLGVVFGLFPESQVASVQVVGKLFIAMLKMLIAPMILLAIAHAIGQMTAARDLGRLGARTVMLYLITMAFAVATGLLLVNLFQPGANSELRETQFFREAASAEAPALAHDLSLQEFLLETVYQVLANPFDSLAQGRILPIVVFAILLGVALLQIGPSARNVVDLLGTGYKAVMRIIAWFIRLAPIGIFALIGHLVATVPFENLVKYLGEFVFVVILGILIHAFVTLPLVARVLTGIGPGELFRGIREALVVAFSTSSSAATLPVTTRCIEENLDVPPRISSFVLPLGATVNMDGTALYEAVAALFVAALYGIDLGIGAQLVIFFVAMVTAIGAPGIPSAGMVTMVVVLESVGLPIEAIGILITIDRFLDTFRTMANVEGDAVVSLCVARTET